MAPMRRALLLLTALPLVACVELGTADPPAPPPAGPAPTLTITSPEAGADVALLADAARTLMVGFAVTDFTLREPGTCLASEQPCGHVLVHVDDDTCNASGASFNAAGAGSPVGAAFVHCAEPEGPHTVRLTLAADDRTPWPGPVEATLDVSTTVPSLYDRLGGNAGITHLVTAALTLHVLPAADVNAYFLNESFDSVHVAGCLVDQIAEAAGGPEEYGCRSMLEAHAGLGISTADFSAFATHIEQAGLYGGLAPADVAELMEILGATESDIVEDPDGTDSLYQRLGRREGIEQVVERFSDALLADLYVSPFFVPEGGTGPVYSARTGVCFFRLICSIDGPCEYGAGTDPELGGLPCLTMRDSHAGMTDPEGNVIDLDAFVRVADLLVQELDAVGVSPVDQEQIVGALVPTCCDIVADNAACAELGVDPACDGG